MVIKNLLFLLFTLPLSGSSLISLSQNYLSAVRYQEEVDSLLTELRTLPTERLFSELNTDRKKKVFWINIYNATVQHALKKDSSAYEHRLTFYGEKRIIIAGEHLSLNDIEHGILRKSQWIYGLGKVRKWFPSDFEKGQRLDSLDARVHFALNCGAKSCPPILFYRLESFEQEIEAATKGFLSENTVLYKETLVLSKLFLYYSGDFGSKQDKIDFAKKYAGLGNLEQVKRIDYAEYDWSLALDMYR